MRCWAIEPVARASRAFSKASLIWSFRLMRPVSTGCGMRIWIDDRTRSVACQARTSADFLERQLRKNDAGSSRGRTRESWWGLAAELLDDVVDLFALGELRIELGRAAQGRHCVCLAAEAHVRQAEVEADGPIGGRPLRRSREQPLCFREGPELVLSPAEGVEHFGGARSELLGLRGEGQRFLRLLL